MARKDDVVFFYQGLVKKLRIFHLQHGLSMDWRVRWELERLITENAWVEKLEIPFHTTDIHEDTQVDTHPGQQILPGIEDK